MTIRLLLLVTVSFMMLNTADVDIAEAGYKGRLVPGTWRKSWDDELKKNLFEVYEENFLGHTENQMEEFCPGYNRSKKKRKTFWHQLFVSLAYKESLHGPRNYVHFNGGKNVGLYQINPVLRSAYGCRGYDLYDPTSNIRCGVKMARRLITKHGSFLVGRKSGMAAYWQPLRATNKLNRRNRSYIMQTVTNACNSNKITYLSTNQVPVWFFDPLETFTRSVNTISDLPKEDLDIILADHPNALDDDYESQVNPKIDVDDIDTGHSDDGDLKYEIHQRPYDVDPDVIEPTVIGDEPVDV